MSTLQLQSSYTDDYVSPRQQADLLFAKQDWLNALAAYRAIPGFQTSSVLQLRIAECCFNLGRFEEAYFSAMQASEFHKSLLRAIQIQGRAACALGWVREWINLTESAYSQALPSPELILDFAQAQLFGVGDALRARSLAEPFVGNAVYGEQASWIVLMSQIYDRPDELGARELSESFHHFAAEYIAPCAQALACINQARQPNNSAVKRIGFVSPLFQASSTMFMALKVFRQLASQGHELIFFSRSPRKDWITAELEKLPGQFVDCSSMSVVQLNSLFAASRLNELYDMCGWLDTEVLKALTTRPAEKLYKWLGGQVCSTGLDCFDGFVTDTSHTPPSTHVLYTEPLISFEPAHRMFIATDKFPSPRKRVGSGSIGKLKRAQSANIGVCCPPVYMGQAFLRALDQLMHSMPQGVRLLLIDIAYTSPQSCDRVRKSLSLSESRLEFLAPEDYLDTLHLMNELDLLVDTFPHSSGVRLLEAKHMKLPVYLFPFDRQLFCERQALAYTLA